VDEGKNLAALWSGEAGERLAGLLSEVIDTDGQMEADGPQWIDIVMALTTGEAVKPRSLSHPRIFIFGTLEARLQSVDTMILGGLNEGSWPGQTVNNPFLSRTMKTDMGLEPPERRIGQLAHDFEMACGTRHLILSRSTLQGSTPTVASRWLQRLLALGGRQFAENLKGRGHQYRDWASMIDAGENQPVAKRPAPKPPADLQPVKYSFSEVGRLRRDPYSIYARRILKLDPLAPFNRDPGASERGTLYHAIMDRYTREGHKPGTPAAKEAMRRITQELFDAEQLPTHIDRVWRPRFVEVARAFLDWEVERAPDILRTMTEVGAGWDLEPAGIRVTGIADRIDIKGSGLADIVDYKTGLEPLRFPKRHGRCSTRSSALEAAALQGRGIPCDAGPAHARTQLRYVRLQSRRAELPGRHGQQRGFERDGRSGSRNPPDRTGRRVPRPSSRELRDHAAQWSGRLRHRDSRLIAQKQRDYGGEYDHLARVAEWSTADDEEAEVDE
jgi:ATP-dependent helicase/nuclease subunit B